MKGKYCMSNHKFIGKWITNEEFSSLEIRNVFHRQLEKVDLPCDKHLDRHILFRKEFNIENIKENTTIYITADDYFKLYINGSFVCQGPAPAYRFQYGYITQNISQYLKEGKNVIAVHTLYQGLINRVWLSGDNCHGLLFDVIADNNCVAKSDDTVLTSVHDGFTPISIVGYYTQFMEDYNSNSDKIGFENLDYYCKNWVPSKYRKNIDYRTVPQKTSCLTVEEIKPIKVITTDEHIFIDFGSTYVGTLSAYAKGNQNTKIFMRFAQELDEDGSLRYKIRANCEYEETWTLSGNSDKLEQYDRKSFRYAELLLPENCVVSDISLVAYHYPFNLVRNIKPKYAKDDKLKQVFNLCVNTLKYGVQEVIQDCMDREKGFYVGDGCYSALSHMLLTDDDSIVRKLIDDAFSSTFICDTMVTCLDCSFMQEIAEYPLMLISLILWHYRVKGDKEYLKKQYQNIINLLEAYRKSYEKDYLLCDLDKWCVVEWPANFRDGYDVDITEGKVCHEPHIAINSYYIIAIDTANTIANILDLPKYRDCETIKEKCREVFFDKSAKLFCDGASTKHKSYIGNVYAMYAGLFKNSSEKEEMYNMIEKKGISSVNLFGSVPLLISLIRDNKTEMVKNLLKDENAWLRIIKEGGTTTFEGWGKDTKWNTSLFHLTLTLAIMFLVDYNGEPLFE